MILDSLQCVINSYILTTKLLNLYVDIIKRRQLLINEPRLKGLKQNAKYLGLFRMTCARIAQLVRSLTASQNVPGSIPAA